VIGIDLPLRSQYFVERGIGLPLADKMRKISSGRRAHRGMSQLLHQQLVQTYAPFSGLVAKRSIDFRGNAADGTGGCRQAICAFCKFGSVRYS
jgi:hypothetical protein